MFKFDDKPRFYYYYEGDEMVCDPIDDCVIGDNFVSFDYNDEPVRMIRNKRTGKYVWRNQAGAEYSGVRGDTPTHAVITGNWHEDGYQGGMVVILPKQQ